MVELTIGKANSIAAATGDALVLPGIGNTLVIAVGGSVDAAAPASAAIRLPDGQASVSLEGTVTAGLGTGIASGSVSAPSASGGSQLEIAATGSIEAGGFAIDAHGGTTLLGNAGAIASGGGILMTGGGNQILNSGTIVGRGLWALSVVSLSGEAASTLANTGSIVGLAAAVAIGADAFQLTSSGRIEAAGDALVIEGNGAIIANAGTIVGGASAIRILSVEGSSSELVNSGTIEGPVAILGRAGSETIINQGLIAGLVQLDGGADRYDGTAGRLTASLELGGGNDTASGGAGSETLDGGAGADTYDGSRASAALAVDLADGTLAGQGDGADRLIGFENVIGSAFADTLRGSAADNLLEGRDGGDGLYGGAGEDILWGGDGADFLRGGTGMDVLTGGAGADRFDINSVADSGPRSSQRDIITDFEHGLDRIDLKTIDASTERSGNQRFKLIGERDFGDNPRELRVVYTETAAILLGDVDGDGKAEFSVKLLGVDNLTSADLVL